MGGYTAVNRKAIEFEMMSFDPKEFWFFGSPTKESKKDWSKS